MKNKNACIILSINAFVGTASALFAVFFLSGWSNVAKIAGFAFPLLCAIAGAVFYRLKKWELFKTAFVVNIIVAVFIGALLFTDKALDLGSYSSDGEKIDKIAQAIRDSGNLGIFVYLLLQILQVVILPLPAIVCYASGAMIWSPLLATIIASVGVIIGSFINYYLGKAFGRKVAVWIAGEKTTEKYSKMLAKRGKGIFLVMQILPFFPDDILCLIAGLTEMSLPFFSAVMILVRPIIIAFYCFLGSGTVIPFHGWGIAVWAGIAAACAAFAALSFKYQDAFEAKLDSWFKRK
ncbi:MAG: TVP38/TMEM64 family protein [Clostridia bacterium]|nr:TVP38/TMEM64 family protein [Clostridia bacterium]